MDHLQTLVAALAALAGLVILAAATLKGWHGWLALKTRELDAGMGDRGAGLTATSGGGRIEIADLKERVRRLEAIAAGVDL